MREKKFLMNFIHDSLVPDVFPFIIIESGRPFSVLHVHNFYISLKFCDDEKIHYDAALLLFTFTAPPQKSFYSFNIQPNMKFYNGLH